MAINENSALVKQVYDCFNRRDWDGIQRLVRKEAVWNDVPSGSQFDGPDGVVLHMKGWTDAFSHGKIEVSRILASNDFALAEGRFTGQHDGALRSPLGDVPPSHRNVDLTFCEIFEFKNGKVLRSNVYPDYLSAVQQVGSFAGRAAEHYEGAGAF